MAFTIHWEERGALEKFSDTLTPADLVRSIEAVGEHHTFDQLRYIIHDCTAVTRYLHDQAAADLAMAMRVGSSFSNNRIRIAFVATLKELAAEFERVITDHSFPFQARLFASIEHARDWVNGKHD